MNSPRVEFFFDFGSPTAYLAYTQLPRIAAECGAELAFRPMLLGGVFKATGNSSPVTVPAKGRWMNDDIARWAQRHGVRFAFNPHFPINTLTLMRGAAGLQLRRPGDFRRYVDAVYRAMWDEPRNLGDERVLAEVLAAAGFDPQEFAALVADAEVKAALIAHTDEAVARGVFGAPTMFVGDRMFFGQDRLDFVREALLAGREAAGRATGISAEAVRRIFAPLESGAGDAFFDHVADDVDWTVEGTHPLAGRYRSKADFRAHTFARLNRILPGGTQLVVEQVLTDGDRAVVELRSMATARDGMRFDNRYCWVMRFSGETIVEVRAYLDSALVQRLIDRNPD